MNSFTLFRDLGVLLLVGGSLVGCGQAIAPSPSESEAIPADAVGEGSETGSEPTATALAPGQYCYQLDTADETGFIRLTVADNQAVSGDASVTIQNEAESYYSSYVQRLEGTVDGSQAFLDVTTWIEYDVQTSQDEWTVTPEALDDGDRLIPAVDCAVAKERFVGPNGLEASDLLSSAANVNTQTLQFAAGTSQAEVSGGVVRGDRDVYLLNAQGGQQMVVEITSLEENAVFDVVDPSGQILAVESTSEDLLLPHTGDYQLIVGGTRGNASYDLSVAIQ